MAQPMVDAHNKAEQKKYTELQKSGKNVKVYNAEELAAFQVEYNKRTKVSSNTSDK